MILRDRSITGGTLNERLYGLQDGNWHMIALCDPASAITERYTYYAYGSTIFLAPTFATQTTSAFAWEYQYCGYRYETGTHLLHVRLRTLHSLLGLWLTRDPAGYTDGPSLQRLYSALNSTDPYGDKIRICFRQFTPGIYKLEDYKGYFEKGFNDFGYKTGPLAHAFIEITFDDGTKCTYSYHPDLWPTEPHAGNFFKSNANQPRPCRIWKNDPVDETLTFKGDPIANKCFEIASGDGAEERLNKYIIDWIKENDCGFEEGSYVRNDKTGNDHGQTKTRLPGKKAPKYWIGGQNCTWWATTMAKDAGVTISKDTLEDMCKFNKGRGIKLFTEPNTNINDDKNAKPTPPNRTDKKPPVKITPAQ